MSIHDCLLAVPHGSLPIEMKTLQAAPEGLPSCDSTAFVIQEERVLAGGRDDAAETACNVRSCRFRKPYPIDSRSAANQNIIAA
jgi:hypothetical protein